MSALPPEAARKLSASLARLASPYDGEVVAAANAAKRILDKHGLGFDALSCPSAEPVARTFREDVQASPWQPRSRPFEVNVNDHRRLAGVLLQMSRWTEWERGFLSSVSGKASLSDKERAKLRELHKAVVR